MPSTGITRIAWPLGALALIAALIEGLWLLLVHHHPLDENVPEVVAICLAAGGLYFVAVHIVFRHDLRGRAALFLVIVAAIAFRVTLLPLPPTLSNDLHRYVWEGRAQLADFNPYLYAPSHPAVEALRGPDYELIPGPEVTAAYGPLVELLFRGAALFGSQLAFKLASLIFDLASLLLVVLLLRQRGDPPVRALVYGWCPLVVLEFAGGGHNDSLMIALLLLALWLHRRDSRAASVAALTAATLSKWAAGIALPLFFRRSGWRAFPVSAAVAVVLSWPYLGAGWNLLAGAGTYAEKWRNNEGLYGLLMAASGHEPVALGLVLGVLAGLALYLAWLRAEPLRACYLLLATVLLLAPTVFPWYLTWLVPFLCFFPNPALLLWTTTVLLSYHVVIGFSALGVWEYQSGLTWLEYLPVCAWLLWRIRPRRASQNGARATGVTKRLD